jgi:hypothetical protein
MQFRSRARRNLLTGFQVEMSSGPGNFAGGIHHVGMRLADQSPLRESRSAGPLEPLPTRGLRDDREGVRQRPKGGGPSGHRSAARRDRLSAPRRGGSGRLFPQPEDPRDTHGTPG